MIQDFILIISCWFLISLWQLIAAPWLIPFLKDKLVDSGWGLGRVLVWLVVSAVIWFGAHLGWPLNQPLHIYSLLGVVAFLSIKRFFDHQDQILDWLQSHWQLVAAEEIIFLLLFVFLCVIRGHNPDINGLEKFMDAGLIQSYLTSPTLPLEDMWLAGEKVNYYTFGHFLGSIVTQYWGLPIEYAYNLLLGLIMGLVGIEAFSLAVNFVSPVLGNKLAKMSKPAEIGSQSQTKLLKAGVVSSLLLTLAGNGHAVWYLILNRGFDGYWYPDATRFIDRTIHEFPAYSFIVSDLHAHVWSLPLVLLLLLGLFLWTKSLAESYQRPVRKIQDLKQRPYLGWAVSVGCLLGLMVGTSTWDVLIYGLFLIVLGLILLIGQKQLFFGLLSSAMAMGLGVLATASAWLLNFKSISEGIFITEEYSPLWQLFVLWGPHLMVSLIGLGLALFLINQPAAIATAAKLDKKSEKKTEVKTKNKNNQSLQQTGRIKTNYHLWIIVALVVTAVLLLILPELVYVKDIYPNHPRANTMFKLTFQAFVMMSLVIAWLVGAIQRPSLFKVPIQLFFKLVLVVFIMSVGVYPYFGYRDFYAGLKNYRSLDGLSWLKQKHPQDYQLIQWMRERIAGRPVILEAVGESYTEFARVSTFTGLPTVLGWRVHEWLWRGGFDIPGARTEEVKLVYEQPLSGQAAEVLDKYQVKYIFVGDKERERYPTMNVEQLRQIGTVYKQTGQSLLLRVNP